MLCVCLLKALNIGNVSARPPKQDCYGAERGGADNDVEDEERVHGFLVGLTRPDDSAAIERGNDVRSRLTGQFAERDQLIGSASHHEDSDATIQTSRSTPVHCFS